MQRKYKRPVGSYGPLKTAKGKGRKKYANLNNYLNAVYRSNKDYLESRIDKTPADKRTKREIFKSEIEKRMQRINPATGKHYTVKEAIDMFQRSELVRSREERIFETRISKMFESDEKAKKQFRQAVGWTSKIDSSNVVDMTSEGNKNYIRYRDPKTGNDVVIEETISPKTGISTGYRILAYNEWKEQYLKKHQDTAANAAEYAVLKALNAGDPNVQRMKKIRGEK